ncbi:hypothetical protein HU200_039777 [Digitaria exilis]|uniref:RNase H type-1 domain-containing protein n=1 Tax=Digitaria exilis TaxID=1010633 RepID=A0A835B8L8_9POAL|nr:hypothetical protein HU200_039777 [Digitaria exilis]
MALGPNPPYHEYKTKTSRVRHPISYQSVPLTSSAAPPLGRKGHPSGDSIHRLSYCVLLRQRASTLRATHIFAPHSRSYAVVHPTCFILRSYDSQRGKPIGSGSADGDKARRHAYAWAPQLTPMPQATPPPKPLLHHHASCSTPPRGAAPLFHECVTALLLRTPAPTPPHPEHVCIAALLLRVLAPTGSGHWLPRKGKREAAAGGYRWGFSGKCDRRGSSRAAGEAETRSQKADNRQPNTLVVRTGHWRPGPAPTRRQVVAHVSPDRPRMAGTGRRAGPPVLSPPPVSLSTPLSHSLTHKSAAPAPLLSHRRYQRRSMMPHRGGVGDGGGPPMRAIDYYRRALFPAPYVVAPPAAAAAVGDSADPSSDVEDPPLDLPAAANPAPRRGGRGAPPPPPPLMALGMPPPYMHALAGLDVAGGQFEAHQRHAHRRGGLPPPLLVVNEGPSRRQANDGDDEATSKEGAAGLPEPEEVYDALKEIPDLARVDLLRAYSALLRDERQFRSLMALRRDMRKDWLLMEIKNTQHRQARRDTSRRSRRASHASRHAAQLAAHVSTPEPHVATASPASAPPAQLRRQQQQQRAMAEPNRAQILRLPSGGAVSPLLRAAGAEPHPPLGGLPAVAPPPAAASGARPLARALRRSGQRCPLLDYDAARRGRRQRIAAAASERAAAAAERAAAVALEVVERRRRREADAEAAVRAARSAAAVSNGGGKQGARAAAALPGDVYEALKAIPYLGRDDLLRGYSALVRDDRRFRALMALPMEMRKDWLLMEIGGNQAITIQPARPIFMSHTPTLYSDAGNRSGQAPEGKEPMRLQVQYEKSPRFCSYCGCMGHDLECGSGEHAQEDLHYGAWMVADMDTWKAGTPRVRPAQSEEPTKARVCLLLVNVVAAQLGVAEAVAEKARDADSSNSRKRGSLEAGLQNAGIDDLKDTASSPMKPPTAKPEEIAATLRGTDSNRDSGGRCPPPLPPSYVSPRDRKRQKKQGSRKGEADDPTLAASVVEDRCFSFCGLELSISSCNSKPPDVGLFRSWPYCVTLEKRGGWDSHDIACAPANTGCSRRRKNKITKLKKANGQFTEDEREMADLTVAVYKDLYQTEGTENMARVLDTVPVEVTDAMNDQLLAEFSMEEVKVALFQMFPTKAPGPDGYPAHFFQRHWDLCGDEVTSVVLRVLRGEIKELLNVHNEALSEKYLGMPTDVGSSVNGAFKYLKDRDPASLSARVLKAVYYPHGDFLDAGEGSRPSRAGRSDTGAEEKEWVQLWSVKVPSKIRVFLWWLARQSLPTGDCNMARAVWALENEEITEFLGQKQETDARAWLVAIMAALPHEALTRVVRKAIHEEQFQSPLSTHCFVERFVVELGQIKEPVQKKRAVQVQVPKWIPPPEGLAKVNVDATLSKNSNLVVAAAVARDRAGNFMGASALVLEGNFEAEIVEAMACREGLALWPAIARMSYEASMEEDRKSRQDKAASVGLILFMKGVTNPLLPISPPPPIGGGEPSTMGQRIDINVFRYDPLSPLSPAAGRSAAAAAAGTRQVEIDWLEIFGSSSTSAYRDVCFVSPPSTPCAAAEGSHSPPPAKRARSGYPARAPLGDSDAGRRPQLRSEAPRGGLGRRPHRRLEARRGGDRAQVEERAIRPVTRVAAKVCTEPSALVDRCLSPRGAPPAAKNDKEAAPPEEIFKALRGIPGLAHDNLLRAYSMLIRDDRLFRSLMALPKNMRKDWLLMEIGNQHLKTPNLQQRTQKKITVFFIAGRYPSSIQPPPMSLLLGLTSPCQRMSNQRIFAEDLLLAAEVEDHHQNCLTRRREFAGAVLPALIFAYDTCLRIDRVIPAAADDALGLMGRPARASCSRTSSRSRRQAHAAANCSSIRNLRMELPASSFPSSAWSSLPLLSPPPRNRQLPITRLPKPPPRGRGQIFSFQRKLSPFSAQEVISGGNLPHFSPSGQAKPLRPLPRSPINSPPPRSLPPPPIAARSAAAAAGSMQRINIDWREVFGSASSPGRGDDVCFESPSVPRAPWAGARASSGGGNGRGTLRPRRTAEALRYEDDRLSPRGWGDAGARRPVTRAAAKVPAPARLPDYQPIMLCGGFAADRGPDARSVAKSVYDFSKISALTARGVDWAMG